LKTRAAKPQRISQAAGGLHVIAPTSIKSIFDLEGKRIVAQTDVGVYDSFTEGFNTLDLKEARALLDELA